MVDSSAPTGHSAADRIERVGETIERINEAKAKAELSEACYFAGRKAFPRVSWSNAGFSEACLERWSTQTAQAVAEQLGTGSGPAEEYLLAACLRRRPGAVETLERDYLFKLAARIRQICRCADVAEDALQILREKLLLPPEPRLSSYENRGRLAAWLSIVAIRTAFDVARSAQRGALHVRALDEEFVSQAVGPESQYSTRQFDGALRQAMREAVRRLPNEQRFALKMQVVAGWSIDQIGRVLATHRSTAARWLLAARAQMEADVREALMRDLGMSADEVVRTMGGMRSQLDVRLSQLFLSTVRQQSSRATEGRP